LFQSDTAFAELSEGVVFVPALLDGSSWTVWIDPADVSAGFVRMHPALTALGWWLTGDDVELVDASGERLGVLVTDGWMVDGRDTDVVLGPRDGSTILPEDGQQSTWPVVHCGGRGVMPEGPSNGRGRRGLDSRRSPVGRLCTGCGVAGRRALVGALVAGLLRHTPVVR
jgi:hypothetical protein